MEGDVMLTKFGKELKKIRIERDEVLRDMATKLDVTVAYLSAVENGNRKVPDSWVGTIARKYNLTEAEIVNLQEAAFENKNSVSVQFDNTNEIEANLALSFARKFKELNSAEALKIQEILDKARR